MHVGDDFPARWTTARLAELVNGSTRAWWQTTGLPYLIEKGVLRKIGGTFVGKRSAIEAALMSL